MGMTARFVDFHCHLDLYPDPQKAIAAADEAGVYTLTVTTTPKAWPRNRDWTKGSRYVRAALGLHPQLVSERANEFNIWERYLDQARYIGEVGLDAGPRYYRSLPQQKEIFERVLTLCAAAGGKVITVHSVRAATAVLDLIEEHLPPKRGTVVLHWFTGTKSEARRAVELGCYFSINGEMLRRERGQDVVASLPLDRLLTETDGPFTKVGDKPTVPSDVRGVVDDLAVSRDMTPGIMAASIVANLRRIIEEMGEPKGL